MRLLYKFILTLSSLFSLPFLVTAQENSTPAKAAEKAGEAVSDVAENVGETVGGVSDNVGDAITRAREIISLEKILTVLVVLALTWLTIRVLGWGFDWAVKRFNRHRLRILRLKPITNVLLWILTIFILVETLFNPTAETLYALGASSALALGFAAQDILKNIFGGLLIIFDRPFQMGDRINVKGNYGEVVGIGIRNTQINTLDDSIVTVPNSAIISDSVSNANSGALDCMVVVDLWLPVDVDIEKVRKIAYEAAITSRYLNIDKPVVILFFDHLDRKPITNVKIKAYVFDARYEKGFAGDVTEAAKKAFLEAGIYEHKGERN